MKKATLLALTLAVSGAQATELTPEEQAKMIDAVSSVLDQARRTQAEALAEADKKIEKALRTETDCMNLYYDSTLESEYKAQGKRTIEFLNWKKKNRDTLKRLSYRKAVKYQIKWLQLTSKVFQEHANKSYDDTPALVLSFLNEFVKDAPDLYGSEKIVQENQMNSAIAKATGINELEIPHWPTSPIKIAPLYRHFIFPPLQQAKDTRKLRIAWEGRIKHEEELIKAWDAGAKGGIQGGGRANNSPRMVQYLERQKPELEWQMQLDLFNAGDKKEACVEMLKLIKQSPPHPKATDWAKQLLDMLRSKPSN